MPTFTTSQSGLQIYKQGVTITFSGTGPLTTTDPVEVAILRKHQLVTETGAVPAVEHWDVVERNRSTGALGARPSASGDRAAVSVTVADADAATKGKVRLTGDLGGTADAPTVPGLAVKANASAVTAALATKATLSTNPADAGKALDAVTGAPLSVESTGGIKPTATKTTSYTAVNGDAVPVDASAGAITVTLPASAADGAAVAVKKTDATLNAVTVVPSGSDTISGQASVLLRDFNVARTFRKVGTTWVVTDGLSPVAGASSSRYDRLRNVYVPSEDALLNFRKALARARLGGRAARVWGRGDSRTAGVLSGTNPNTLAARDFVWFARMRQILAATQALGKVEESILMFAGDSRFTIGSGWSGTPLAATSAASGTVTFSDAAGHDAYDLVIIRQGSAASIPVTIDGGSTQTVSLAGITNNTGGTVRVPATGTGAHTVVIGAPASGTVHLVAVEPVDTSNPPIVKIGGLGVSGQTLAALNPTVTTSGSAMWGILQGGPDLMFLQMGTNDMRASADLTAGAATYKTNAAAFVASFRAINCDVVLEAFATYNSNQSGQASAYESLPFHQALYELADSSNCVLFDQARRWGYGVGPTTGSATTPVSSSAMYDGTHETLYGYADTGMAKARLLASV